MYEARNVTSTRGEWNLIRKIDFVKSYSYTSNLEKGVWPLSLAVEE